MEELYKEYHSQTRSIKTCGSGTSTVRKQELRSSFGINIELVTIVTILGKVTYPRMQPSMDGDSPRDMDYYRNDNSYGEVTILGMVTVQGTVMLLRMIAMVGAIDWTPHI